MIFVITGTNRRPFDRLVQAVDKIAELRGHDFLIQSGYSTFVPKHCKFFDFCDGETFLSYIKASDLVISQAGFGSIGHCIKLNKPVILVPREDEYGEAVDKQYELAEYLASENDSILCVRDVALLCDAIDKLEDSQPAYHHRTKIPRLIEKFIQKNFLE